MLSSAMQSATVSRLGNPDIRPVLPVESDKKSTTQVDKIVPSTVADGSSFSKAEMQGQSKASTTKLTTEITELTELIRNPPPPKTKESGEQKLPFGNLSPAGIKQLTDLQEKVNKKSGVAAQLLPMLQKKQDKEIDFSKGLSLANFGKTMRTMREDGMWKGTKNILGQVKEAGKEKLAKGVGSKVGGFFAETGLPYLEKFGENLKASSDAFVEEKETKRAVKAEQKEETEKKLEEDLEAHREAQKRRMAGITDETELRQIILKEAREKEKEAAEALEAHKKDSAKKKMLEEMKATGQMSTKMFDDLSAGLQEKIDSFEESGEKKSESKETFGPEQAKSASEFLELDDISPVPVEAVDEIPVEKVESIPVVHPASIPVDVPAPIPSQPLQIDFTPFEEALKKFQPSVPLGKSTTVDTSVQTTSGNENIITTGDSGKVQSRKAELSGMGAVAQDKGIAAGSGAVIVSGDVLGDIKLGKGKPKVDDSSGFTLKGPEGISVASDLSEVVECLRVFTSRATTPGSIYTHDIHTEDLQKQSIEDQKISSMRMADDFTQRHKETTSILKETAESEAAQAEVVKEEHRVKGKDDVAAKEKMAAKEEDQRFDELKDGIEESGDKNTDRVIDALDALGKTFIGAVGAMSQGGGDGGGSMLDTASDFLGGRKKKRGKGPGKKKLRKRKNEARKDYKARQKKYDTASKNKRKKLADRDNVDKKKRTSDRKENLDTRRGTPDTSKKPGSRRKKVLGGITGLATMAVPSLIGASDGSLTGEAMQMAQEEAVDAGIDKATDIAQDKIEKKAAKKAAASATKKVGAGIGKKVGAEAAEMAAKKGGKKLATKTAAKMAAKTGAKIVAKQGAKAAAGLVAAGTIAAPAIALASAGMLGWEIGTLINDVMSEKTGSSTWAIDWACDKPLPNPELKREDWKDPSKLKVAIATLEGQIKQKEGEFWTSSMDQVEIDGKKTMLGMYKSALKRAESRSGQRKVDKKETKSIVTKPSPIKPDEKDRVKTKTPEDKEKIIKTETAELASAAAVAEKKLVGDDAKMENLPDITDVSISIKPPEQPKVGAKVVKDADFKLPSQKPVVEKKVQTKATVTDASEEGMEKVKTTLKGTERLEEVDIKKVTHGKPLAGVHPEFQRRLGNAIMEYNSITGQNKTFQVNSAYRSPRDQADLWKQHLAGKGPPAAYPGSSVHNWGFGVDGQSKILDDMDKMGLLTKHGITRPIKKEKWHTEPVGIDRKLLKRGRATLESPTQFAKIKIDGTKSTGLSATTPKPESSLSASAAKVKVASASDGKLANIDSNAMVKAVREEKTVSDLLGKEQVSIAKAIPEKLPNVKAMSMTPIPVDTPKKLIELTKNSERAKALTTKETIDTGGKPQAPPPQVVQIGSPGGKKSGGGGQRKTTKIEDAGVELLRTLLT